MRALTFSVIVPTHHRPRQLASCLEALALADYPKEAFEVIVVADGDPSNLESVIPPFHGRLTVSLIRQNRRGPAYARNRGADRAAGSFLAFTDDDCRPDPAWLRELEMQLAATPDDMIGGQTINAAHEDPYAGASQWILDFFSTRYSRSFPDRRFFTSNNIAMSGRLFREAGGFCEDFPLPAAEDREFCDRWLRAGLRLTYREGAIVRHEHRMRFRDFWNQHFRYGLGACQYRRLARDHGLSVPFERPEVYWGLISASARKSFRRGSLVAISQLAVACGYFRQVMSSRPLAPAPAKLEMPPAG